MVQIRQFTEYEIAQPKQGKNKILVQRKFNTPTFFVWYVRTRYQVSEVPVKC